MSESRYAAWWPSQALRAAGALVVGFCITFTANHNAGFGLVMLATLAAISAWCMAWGAAGLRDRVLKGVSLAMVVVGLAVAALVLVLMVAFPGARIGVLLVALSGWAGVTGALELYLGLRGRSIGHPAARDWLLIGGITAILALLVLLIPADLRQPWQSDGVSGVLTADIVASGALGAYAIVIGVVLGIAALSGRFVVADARRAVAEPVPAESNGVSS